MPRNYRNYEYDMDEGPPKKRGRGRLPKNDEINNNNSQSEVESRIHNLSILKVGQRVAYTFSDSIYFGSIVRCSKPKSNDKDRKDDATRWRWEVEFDDDDCWELDSNNMLSAISLYEKCKKEEMEDKSRNEKVDGIINEFFAEKYKILNALSDEIKNDFLEVGFAKWNRSYLPVLFLGPYDLSPGHIRDKWMKYFDRAEGDPRKLKNLPRIIYWYGFPIQEAFSIMPRGDCLSCEEGTKRGFSYIPLPIHRKLESGSKLTKMEDSFVTGLDAMMKDMRKPREERPIPFVKVLEDYQLVVRGMRLVTEIEAKNRLNLEGKML
mmetsp:Transcript_26427/g.39072  ORF Transcript_26427/g.39072 Transcript_26427/m.39072 type:complete len:321 (-) Transcript_26427:1419-2381(-)